MSLAVCAEYEFAKSDSGYELVTADGSVVIDAARLRWSGDDLKGEITIYAGGEDIGPVSFVFTSATSRRDIAGLFVEGEEVRKAVNELCRRVVHAERNGSSPVVRLRDVARPSADREYSVPTLPPLPRTSMAIWFGDGGTGKSLLALCVAGSLAQQGIRVLYLDWELSADDHRIRFEQLFGANMPPDLHYWQCERPLTQMVDSIRQNVRKMHIDYVVVDSIAFACGGNAESSEVAAQYGLAARSFGVGSLHLAHVSKTGKAAKHKPFGSTFWHNAARSTWYLESTGTRTRDAGVTETTLEWHHRKNNFGPVEKSSRTISFTVDIVSDRIQIDSEQPATAAGKMTIPARIRAALANGRRLSRADLKRVLSDVNEDSLKTTIKRGLRDAWLDEDAHKQIGVRVQTEGGLAA